VIPVTIVVDVVMSWYVVVVIVVANVAAGMVVEVRCIVPNAMTAPVTMSAPVTMTAAMSITASVTVAMPTASVMSVMAVTVVGTTNVDMEAATPKVESLRFRGICI
jgi:hypothetical protein